MLRLGCCGDPEAGICTCTEKKRKRMDSKGGGGAVCQCVYRRSDENREIGGEVRIAAAGIEETRLGRWSELE